jgi:hypothetical protein
MTVSKTNTTSFHNFLEENVDLKQEKFASLPVNPKYKEITQNKTKSASMSKFADAFEYIKSPEDLEKYASVIEKAEAVLSDSMKRNLRSLAMVKTAGWWNKWVKSPDLKPTIKNYVFKVKPNYTVMDIEKDLKNYGFKVEKVVKPGGRNKPDRELFQVQQTEGWFKPTVKDTITLDPQRLIARAQRNEAKIQAAQQQNTGFLAKGKQFIKDLKDAESWDQRFDKVVDFLGTDTGKTLVTGGKNLLSGYLNSRNNWVVPAVAAGTGGLLLGGMTNRRQEPNYAAASDGEDLYELYMNKEAAGRGANISNFIKRQQKAFAPNRIITNSKRTVSSVQNNKKQLLERLKEKSQNAKNKVHAKNIKDNITGQVASNQEGITSRSKDLTSALGNRASELKQNITDRLANTVNISSRSRDLTSALGDYASELKHSPAHRITITGEIPTSVIPNVATKQVNTKTRNTKNTQTKKTTQTGDKESKKVNTKNNTGSGIATLVGLGALGATGVLGLKALRRRNNNWLLPAAIGTALIGGATLLNRNPNKKSRTASDVEDLYELYTNKQASRSSRVKRFRKLLQSTQSTNIHPISNIQQQTVSNLVNSMHITPSTNPINNIQQQVVSPATHATSPAAKITTHTKSVNKNNTNVNRNNTNVNKNNTNVNKNNKNLNKKNNKKVDWEKRLLGAGVLGGLGLLGVAALRKKKNDWVLPLATIGAIGAGIGGAELFPHQSNSKSGSANNWNSLYQLYKSKKATDLPEPVKPPSKTNLSFFGLPIWKHEQGYSYDPHKLKDIARARGQGEARTLLSLTGQYLMNPKILAGGALAAGGLYMGNKLYQMKQKELQKLNEEEMLDKYHEQLAGGFH